MTLLTERLLPLAERAWDMHAAAQSRLDGVVVDPSMPILYFGDAAGYERSPVRVITVGLNPSLQEFPAASPWSRFPTAGPDTRGEAYLYALNAYFAPTAYHRWFGGGFEHLLLGLGASYYGGASSTALHTDLFSPIATDPTWSKLGARRGQLATEGVELWRELVRVLEPDVVVVSVAARHLPLITDRPLAEWDVVDQLERRRPYEIRATRTPVAGQEMVVVFGRAAQLPFGSVSHAQKRRIGQLVASYVEREGICRQ